MKEWLNKNLKGDPVIWTVISLLVVIGIATVYSAVGALAYRKMDFDTEHFLRKHAILMFAALVTMYYTHKVNADWFRKFTPLFLVVSIPLLMFAILFGKRLNDANRWIEIPLIHQQFQPSDLAKLALISFVAMVLAKYQTQMDKEAIQWKVFWRICIPMVIICGLIAYSNFSTAGMLFITVMLLMYIGRVKWKFFLIILTPIIFAGIMAFSFGQRGGTLSKRIATYLDPTEVSYQSEQSYIAIANGGFFGKGPGQSHQKDFLPHPYSDFIYAIIIEEYGMIGGTFTLVCYLVLLYRGMLIISKRKKPFPGLLSAGLSFSLAIQAFFNMSVAVGLAPVTGQPLPLLSMGGTSLVFTGLSLGMLLSISKDEQDATTPNVATAASV